MANQFLDLTGLNHVWQQINNLFQRKLVSGTNIKTINNQSLVGSGNLDVTIDLSDYATQTWVNTQGFAKGSFLPLTGGTLTGAVYITDNLYLPALNNEYMAITLSQSAGVTISYDNFTTTIRESIIFKAANGSALMNDAVELGVTAGRVGLKIYDSTGINVIILDPTVGLSLKEGLGVQEQGDGGKDTILWNTAGGKTTIEILTEEEITAILV